jgi:hypothetical protein
VLTDRLGRVHWVGSGAHTDEAGTALRDAVEALSPN